MCPTVRKPVSSTCDQMERPSTDSKNVTVGDPLSASVQLVIRATPGQTGEWLKVRARTDVGSQDARLGSRFIAWCNDLQNLLRKVLRMEFVLPKKTQSEASSVAPDPRFSNCPAVLCWSRQGRER